MELKTAQRATVLGVLTGALMALGACGAVQTFYDDYMPVSSADCEERTIRQLEGVDFTSAVQIEMIIRRGEFSPMIITLTKGKAYTLRMRNRDDAEHAFNAPDFFDNIAVAAVALNNDILPTVCPGPVVTVQPGQDFEMQFLAASDGVYEYRDVGGVGLSFGNVLNTAPPGGIIRIEESY